MPFVGFSHSQIRELKDAFDALDVNANGSIELKEVKVALRALGFEPKKDEVRIILAELDKRALQDGRAPRAPNGKISFETFQEIREYKANENEPRSLLRKSFQLFVDSAGMYSPALILSTRFRIHIVRLAQESVYRCPNNSVR